MDDAEIAPAASTDTASSKVEDVLWSVNSEVMESMDGENGEEHPQLDTDEWSRTDDSVETLSSWRETGSSEAEDENVVEEGEANASNTSEDNVPQNERIPVNTEGETSEGNSTDENADQGGLESTSLESLMEAEESEGGYNQIEDEASLAGTDEEVETENVTTSSKDQSDDRTADMEENERELQENTVDSISNQVDGGDEELSASESGGEHLDNDQSVEGSPSGVEEPTEVQDGLIRSSDENQELWTGVENVEEAVTDEENSTREEVEPAEEQAVEVEELSPPAPSEELESEEWINVEEDTPVLSIDGEEERQALDESSSPADEGEAKETPDVVTDERDVPSLSMEDTETEEAETEVEVSSPRPFATTVVTDEGDVPNSSMEDTETEEALEAETEVEVSSTQPLATPDTEEQEQDHLETSEAESEDFREVAKAEEFPENDTSEPEEEVYSSNHISFEDSDNALVVDAEIGLTSPTEVENPTSAVLQDPLPEDTELSVKEEESTLDEVEEPEYNGSPETALRSAEPPSSRTEENTFFRADDQSAGETTEDQKDLAGRRDPDTSSEDSPDVVEITGKLLNDQSSHVLHNGGVRLQETYEAPDSVSAENTEEKSIPNLDEEDVAATMRFPTEPEDELPKIESMLESRVPEQGNEMSARGGEVSPLQVETGSMQKDEPSIPLSTFSGDLTSSWAAATGKSGKDVSEKQSEIHNKSSLTETDRPYPSIGSVPKVRAQIARESDDSSEVKFPFSIMLWCSQALSSLFGSSKSL
ncbi:hypothetical protein R1sor_016787 [Riccia sorocarpa]|uniref:Uncharacterized protein n=1 Tax=Riccia sorocarpa TaxID=122646 RepID=A0ABD3HGE9_9MARC